MQMAGLRELALFAGAGGGILAGQMLGWRTVCAVERDAYCAAVLAQRQNDGLLDLFPIWSDVETFDGTRWRGIVDVVSGGFPCQDISAAGRGEGIGGSRSGLWTEFARIISEVRPSYVFIENSPMLTNRGLDRVLCDLAEMGFNAEWGCVSAAEVGAPHKRERIWIVAYSNSDRLQGVKKVICTKTSKETDAWPDIKGISSKIHRSEQNSIPIAWVNVSDDGLANRVDQTKAIGNGQVPQCASEAWDILINRVKIQTGEYFK